jgi:phage terminase small subunit
VALNEKQKAFAEHYAACFNAAEAARKAGYSEKTARAIGQRLLTNVDIQKYLQEIKENAKSSRIATIDEVLTYLSDTMRNTDEQTKERTKAAQILREALSAVKAESDDAATEIVVVPVDASVDGGI